MRLRLRSFLLTSALTFAPAVASATTISGLYVDGGAGYNEVQDQHVHANYSADGSAAPKFTVNHGTGYTGFGAVGWGFGNGLRVEAEGLYNFSHDNYTSYAQENNDAQTSTTPVLLKNGTSLKQYELPCGTSQGYYTTVFQSWACPKGSNLTDNLSFTPNSQFTPPIEGGSGSVWGYDPNIAGASQATKALGFDPTLAIGVIQFKDLDFQTNSGASPSDWSSCPNCYMVNVENYKAAFGGNPWADAPSGDQGVTPQSDENPKTDPSNFPDIITPQDQQYVEHYLDDLESQGLIPKGTYYLGDAYEGKSLTSSWDFQFNDDLGNDVCNPNKGCISYHEFTAITNWHAIDGKPTNPKMNKFYPTSTNLTNAPQTAAINHNGTDESWGGFANVLYDFDLERLFGLKSIATPFIGGGAGYLWQRYNRPNTMIAAITGTHGGFSWQGIAGVAFDTGITGLQVVAQYRMIGQPGSFYNGTFNYGTEGGHAHFDQRFNHQFIVGFRYAFHNQPVHITPPSVSRAFATAAAAAPAPVPARSYLVFFDWNQYALTSRARQIVVEAAHATSYVHTTRINVNGYTDSSAAPGPAGQKYNYALSVKRARSVQAELIRNGVPASEIVVLGYGDTNPLVPTGPNTREPQNRRVEIILHVCACENTRKEALQKCGRVESLTNAGA